MTRTAPRRRRRPDKLSQPAPPVAEKRHWIADWAVQLVVLLFAGTSVGWTSIVPTGSMENTVMPGDHLIVDSIAYAPPDRLMGRLLPYQQVKRGDIIVFRYPLDIRQNYVKRVIGMPGDRIRIVDKTVWLNGHPIQEPYKILIDGQRSDYLNNFPRRPDIRIYPRGLVMLQDHVRGGELIVPEGYYFAMGDNRDNSEDSRFWGLVPRENIWGKPVLVFWSFEATTEEFNNRTYWFDAALHFFSRTRWDHTMRLVRGYDLR
jgi:signal peptidase I